MEVFAMTQSNQQSAHAAADHPYSGQTLLGVSRRTAIKTLGMAAGALLLPVGFSSTTFATRLQAKGPAKNPRHHGRSARRVRLPEDLFRRPLQRSTQRKPQLNLVNETIVTP